MLLFLEKGGKRVVGDQAKVYNVIISSPGSLQHCVKFCYLFAFVYSPSPPFPLSKFFVESYGGNGRIIFPQPAQSQMEQFAFFAKIKEEKKFYSFLGKKGRSRLSVFY